MAGNKLMVILRAVLMIWAVTFYIVFLARRVAIGYDAVYAAYDMREHDANFCLACIEGGLVKKGGRHAEECPAACDRATHKIWRPSIAMSAIANATYLCGDHPCAEMLNIRGFLFFMVLAYASRLLVKRVADEDVAGAKPGQSSVPMRILQSIGAFVHEGITTLGRALATFFVPKPQVKLD
jgi:hypothetical protein